MMRASRRILRIFAKGNVDVRDSLLWSRVGGVLEWNGINEVIRARHPGVLAKIKHETCTRLDLIPLPGEVPPLEPPEEIARRLRTAELELGERNSYDYVIHSGTKEQDFRALLAFWDQARRKLG